MPRVTPSFLLWIWVLAFIRGLFAFVRGDLVRVEDLAFGAARCARLREAAPRRVAAVPFLVVLFFKR